MEVFKPISTSQTLIIIPRRNASSVTLNIRDEDTDSIQSMSLSTTYLNGYLSMDFAYDFHEGGNYELEVTDANGLLWRGKAFATSQTPQEYHLNNDLITL